MTNKDRREEIKKCSFGLSDNEGYLGNVSIEMRIRLHPSEEYKKRRGKKLVEKAWKYYFSALAIHLLPTIRDRVAFKIKQYVDGGQEKEGGQA